MSSEPLDEDFRNIGFTLEARKFKMSEKAMRAFCAWSNLDITKAPEPYWYRPNQTCLSAWERVGQLIEKENER